MSFDTHPDLIIRPYSNGVQLEEPENEANLFLNIGSLYNTPLMVYFVDFDASFINANHVTRLSNIPGNQGYSEHDLKNTSFRSLFKKEAVDGFTFNNNKNFRN
jgi:hypothetical protein